MQETNDYSVANENCLNKDVSTGSNSIDLSEEFCGIPDSLTRLLELDNQMYGGKSLERRNVSMAMFARTNEEAYKDLAKEVQEVGHQFFRYVNGETINSSWRYITDVLLYRDSEQLNRYLHCLFNYGRTRSNGMFGISVEHNHIHVIHDCSFSDGTCRCVWRKQVESIGEIKPLRKEAKPIWKFTRTDWYDVFIYFFLRKRGTRQIWIRGENWQVPSDSQLVRWEEKYNSWRQMVRVEDSGSDSECERQSNKRTSRAASLTHNNEIYGKRPAKAGKFSYIRTETKTLLLKYYTCPVSSIRDVKEFRDNAVLSDPKNKDYIQASFDDFGKDLNDLKLRDFYNMLTKEDCNPKFITSMDYGSMEDSIKIVNELLRYQFNDCLESITHFLTSLVDVLDKRLPKCNCISVKSPPSAGKNFFFDMVLAILLNYGQLGQANKHNVFAFQEAPNKRVLLWNEPNYCGSLTDTIKMMLGGDPYTVRVKHAMDTHVARTPVIVLTNNHVPFLSDIAFRERVVKFDWKHAPFLKNIEYKPYPMCFFEILKQYEINF